MSNTKDLRDHVAEAKELLADASALLRQATWALDTLTQRLTEPSSVTPSADDAADDESIRSGDGDVALAPAPDDGPSVRQRRRWVRGLQRPS